MRMPLLIVYCMLFGQIEAQTDCEWQPDSNEDYFVSVTDVLAVLGVFGQIDSDQDGLWDGSDQCTDTAACNYAATPSVPCAFLDESGICGGSNVVPELLIGSWTISQAAGALEVGPSPGSNEWYSSAAFGLQSAQYDDIYTFQEDGSLVADYNGTIIDAFQDYSEQSFECSPIDFEFSPGASASSSPSIALLAESTTCSCPFIGTNDAGLVYTISYLDASTMELQAQGDDSSCEPNDLYFSFTFVRVGDESGDDTGYPAPESYPGMDLVWSDEFDGTTVNLQNWTYDLGSNGWGNNEWQNYTNSSSNSSVSNGALTITARQEGSSYSSARLKTQGLQDFQFGRIDIRAKLPEGQGIWPAIWMLGINISDGGWPQCGEIDIMEMVGHEASTAHGTAHWGSEWNFHQYSGSSITLPNGEHFSEEFHLFSVDWQEDQITWYMDNQEFYSIGANQMNGQPYPFNASFFFIMNVAVGGDWPGYPDATTTFPQEMIVDCVRVFQ
ncbi:MAG: glycoside hydrolase family 16 protein [Crocinitomicaceae bacterium]|nr:glycoside hydrolase family 16 protein [Crocinitomicaceae bacterium]